jgi:hypothetical protein
LSQQVSHEKQAALRRTCLPVRLSVYEGRRVVRVDAKSRPTGMHGASAALREGRWENLDHPETRRGFQTFAQRDLLNVIHATFGVANPLRVKTRSESAFRCFNDGSIRVFAFSGVFQNAPGIGVDADLLRNMAVPDIERIAKATAAGLVFQFFIRNLARVRSQSDRASLFDVDFCVLGQLFAGVTHCRPSA